MTTPEFRGYLAERLDQIGPTKLNALEQILGAQDDTQVANDAFISGVQNLHQTLPPVGTEARTKAMQVLAAEMAVEGQNVVLLAKLAGGAINALYYAGDRVLITARTTARQARA